MPYVLPTLLLTTLFGASLPPLFFYSTASWKLLAYESATKKAAKVTSEAGRQLRKTRLTQGAAILASLTFASCSAALLKDLFSPAAETERRVWWHVELALLSLIVGGAADVYVSGFWKGAMKVPSIPGLGGTGYNDAVRATENGMWWSRNELMGWGVYALYALTFQVKGDRS